MLLFLNYLIKISITEILLCKFKWKLTVGRDNFEKLFNAQLKPVLLVITSKTHKISDVSSKRLKDECDASPVLMQKILDIAISDVRKKLGKRVLSQNQQMLRNLLFRKSSATCDAGFSHYFFSSQFFVMLLKFHIRKLRQLQRKLCYLQRYQLLCKLKRKNLCVTFTL